MNSQSASKTLNKRKDIKVEKRRLSFEEKREMIAALSKLSFCYVLTGYVLTFEQSKEREREKV